MELMATDPKDLGKLLKAVNDAAGKASVLWTTFVVFELYLAIAFGSVTHRSLFLEEPIKLPLLNVDLPLVGFFVVAPTILLIFHFYVFLQLLALTKKAKDYDTLLRQETRLASDRQYLRQRLDSFLVLQFLAGPTDQRTGFSGFSLRLIVWLTLVGIPVLILLQAQMTFLPYHHEQVQWLQRVTVLLDLAVIWYFRNYVRGDHHPILARVPRGAWKLANAAATICVVILSIGLATFPGEFADRNLPNVRLIPTTWQPRWSYKTHWTSLYELLFAGATDEITGRSRSLFSNRLILTDQSFVDPHNLDKVNTSRSFRGRDLREAVFSRADLRKADFTGAILIGAKLVSANLKEAQLRCAKTGIIEKANEKLVCTLLQGASLYEAQLQGANLEGAKLQDVSLVGANLLGANLDGADLRHANLHSAQLQRASLIEAQLQNASLMEAKLQDSKLDRAELQEASIARAWLQHASLIEAKLQGASLRQAKLQGANLQGANLEGADLYGAELQGADLSWADLSGASVVAQLQGANLRGAGLRGANLDLASLEGANLYSASLAGASLVRANLEGANLIAAGLVDATLDEARLQGALLDRANLKGASLAKARVWFVRGMPKIYLTNLDQVDPSTKPWEESSVSCGLKPCSTFAAWSEGVVQEIPLGRRNLAVTRLSVLDTERDVMTRLLAQDPELDEKPKQLLDDKFWAGSPGSQREESERRLAALLLDLVCESFLESDAHYIVRGLVRNGRLLATGTQITIVVDRLRKGKSDKASCRGVQGFIDEDWKKLDEDVALAARRARKTGEQ
jgi:uncharacterized protein YjbI with pentapeptide repeats